MYRVLQGIALAALLAGAALAENASRVVGGVLRLSASNSEGNAWVGLIIDSFERDAALHTYRWTLEADTLHLDMIGNDECSGRQSILDDATYERRG